MTVCAECGKQNLEQNERGLSQKYLGRGTVRFLCYSCMAKFLGTTEEAMRAQVRRFQMQGCGLFSPYDPNQKP